GAGVRRARLRPDLRARAGRSARGLDRQPVPLLRKQGAAARGHLRRAHRRPRPRGGRGLRGGRHGRGGPAGDRPPVGRPGHGAPRPHARVPAGAPRDAGPGLASRPRRAQAVRADRRGRARAGRRGRHGRVRRRSPRALGPARDGQPHRAVVPPARPPERRGDRRRLRRPAAVL
ncbi:MAG: Transcriptional regulator, AcrR family, partial [uncultured Solirubrobacteraceae bacterium]